MSTANLIKQVTEVAREAPPSITEITVQILASAKEHGPESLAAAAMARLLRAVIVALSHNDKGLINVVSAPSDLQALLAFLEEPAVIAELEAIDPLAPAKMRGILRKAELLNAEGGCVNGESAGALVGVSRQSIDRARQRDDVLALPRGQDSWVYPVWQFEGGRYLPGLKGVLKALAQEGPWVQASFLLSDNALLDGKAPLALLRCGATGQVVDAAQKFGQQGGS